jgi:hypothetical protein
MSVSNQKSNKTRMDLAIATDLVEASSDNHDQRRRQAAAVTPPAPEDSMDDATFVFDGTPYPSYHAMCVAKQRHNEQRLAELMQKVPRLERQRQKSTPAKRRSPPSQPVRRSTRTSIPANASHGEKLVYLDLDDEPRIPKRRRVKPSSSSLTPHRRIPPRPLEGELPATTAEPPAWLGEMEEFLRSIQRVSEANLRSVMRQVTKFAMGYGVHYGDWAETFGQGRAMPTLEACLSIDFDQMYEEACQHEDTYGEDRGHGWAIRHPVKKLLYFQQWKLGQG